MRTLVAVAATVCVATVFASTVALAETPTPVPSTTRTVTPAATMTPAPTPSAVATPSELALTYDEKATGCGSASSSGCRISWNAIPGATSYRLSGSIAAEETGPGGLTCAASPPHRVVPIKLDETLPATATSFSLPLEALPASEYWTITANSIVLTAYDAHGSQIARGNHGQIVESCAFLDAQRRPTVVLPSTGSPGAGARAGANVALAALAIAGGAAVVVGMRRAVRRR